MRSTSTDVLIAGAGPVGLLLAGELRRAGVRVTIVERLASPMTESRASQINTRTAELLHERSFDALLAPDARETGAHFAGLPLDLTGLDSEYAGNWKVPQFRTEAVLAERADELGVVLLREHELAGIEQLGDRVRCVVDTPSGGREFEAAYVVGCDGAGSTVRRLGGFEVDLRPPTKELLRADVKGLDIRNRRFERLPGGFAVAVTRDGVTRVMVHAAGQPPVTRTAPPEFAEVVLLWEKVTGEDISGGTPIWIDAFDNAVGLVRAYRRGRILLAGDAAHWHMPIGGQALNIGLLDAVNLGWKLAATVNGSAPPEVLDSYHRERHTAAERMLAFVSAQEILQLGGPEVNELRAVLAEILTLPAAHDHLVRVGAGLGGPAGDHAPIGMRLPRATLRTADGVVSTAELLAGSEGFVLRLGDTASPKPIPLEGGHELRTVNAVPSPADAFGDAAALLVRPDGWVAWAGDDEAGLDAAIRRWFGRPVGDSVGVAD